MFNSPPGTSDAMDLAKMLAALDLITPLRDEKFNIWTQTRIGLLSHPLDGHAARGHLAASAYLQMALRPDIYHIVGHTEADHAATADDIIEAVKITRRAIQNALGAPDMRQSPEVQARKEELTAETRVLLDAIRELAPTGVADPWADSATLARSVTLGLMDAPQLRNNKFGRGETRTRVVDGKSVAVDESGRLLSEKERVSALKKESK
jgi:hypothetical protein